MSHPDSAVRMAGSPIFVVKANGPQTVLAGGMVRSSGAGKIDYTLALDGVMFERLAAHLTKATQPPANYPKRNWLLSCEPATSESDLGVQKETLERYRVSAARHFIQWMRGDTDEDHVAALWFNTNGYETLKEAMKNAQV